MCMKLRHAKLGIGANPAQKSQEVGSMFPDKLFISLVKISNQICNFGSFVLLTILTNDHIVFNIGLKTT